GPGARPILLVGPDPDGPVLQAPTGPVRARQRTRHAVRPVDAEREERGPSRGRLVRRPGLLHLDPGALAQRPLRVGRAPRAEDVGRLARRGPAAPAEGASDGHAVLPLQRREPPLARVALLLRPQ